MNAIEMFRSMAIAIDSLDLLEGDEKTHLNTLITCLKGLGITLNDSVKEVYEHTFTDDELGSEINKTLTFKKLFDSMNSNCDFYATIGVGDSIVRCRIFWLLSGIFNASGTNMRYSDLYDLWCYNKQIENLRALGIA